MVQSSRVHVAFARGLDSFGTLVGHRLAVHLWVRVRVRVRVSVS